MRNIKPCPRPRRFALGDRTLNSNKAPLTVWFNHAVLVKSRELTAVRARFDECNDQFVVEIKERGGDAKQILRVPSHFGYLIAVSR